MKGQGFADCCNSPAKMPEIIRESSSDGALIDTIAEDTQKKKNYCY